MRASVREFARNSTQARQVRQKVTATRNSCRGSSFPERPSFSMAFFRRGSKSRDTTWYRPFKSPQATKVSAAPCHKPETKNTMRIFRQVRPFPFRLPPRGK